jgi:hypothetical protein
MVKRMFPLLLALAVAGAPVALEACQVACASTSAHTAMTQAKHDGAHLCHEDAVKPGPQLSDVPHACDHDSDQPSTPSIASARSTRVVPLALNLTNTAIVASVPTATFFPALGPRLLQSAGFPLPIPLRI